MTLRRQYDTVVSDSPSPTTRFFATLQNDNGTGMLNILVLYWTLLGLDSDDIYGFLLPALPLS